MVSVKCCRFQLRLIHYFLVWHSQLSVQHSGKRKCSHCVARLHMCACNPTPLCNALEHNPGDVQSINTRIGWMFAAMSNISYFEGKFPPVIFMGD